MEVNTSMLLKLECDGPSNSELFDDSIELGETNVKEEIEDEDMVPECCAMCKICKEKFPSIKIFLAHYQIKHMGLKPYVCGKCNCGFDSIILLKEHHWTHRKRKRNPHTTDDEQNNYDDDDVDCHSTKKLKTNDDDLFVCDVCGQCCLNMKNYDSHVRTHVRKNPHVCTACECWFVEDLDLAQHNTIHHNNTKKKFTCNACGHWFATRSCFANHTKVCKSTNLYVCKICYKPYISTGEEKFCCNICVKEVSSLSDLKRIQNVGKLEQNKCSGIDEKSTNSDNNRKDM